MSDTSIRLPSGVRDFLPQAARRRVRIASELLETFQLWGYQRIITPLFECADVLERGLGRDSKATAIRFIEPATGEVVALRPDITPQIARIAATRMAGSGGPLRLCYQGAVARMGQGARGQREVLQAGVERIGAGGYLADAELLALAAASTESVNVPSRSIDVGHVALAALALAELPEEALADVKSCLRRKDRRGVEALTSSLSPKAREMLSALPTLFGRPDEVLRRARTLPLPPAVRAQLDELERAIEWARSLLPDSELLRDLTLDLGELRGFEYYTGMRVSAYVKGAGAPVLRGGRYDDLVARYGHKAQATGFAFDVEAVAQAESALGDLALDESPGCLVVFSEVHRELAGAVASQLRGAGIRVAASAEESMDATSAEALWGYGQQAGLPAVAHLQSEQFCVLHGAPTAKTLWRMGDRASHPTAQSISDALVTMLSGRTS